MRLNSYILTEGRGTQIEEGDAISFIKTHCKKALKAFLDNDILYRGMEYNGEYYHIDPKTGTRESANTSNEYTLIMDGNSRWKEYPKRSKSLVCTTSSRKTNSYGHTYMVFAKDGSRYGVCPKDDLWDSFSTFGGMNMSSVNHYLRDLALETGDGEIYNANTYQKLMYNITSMGEYLDDIVKNRTEAGDDVIDRLMDNDIFRMWYKVKHNPFTEWFIGLYDPNKNDFYVTEDVSKIFSTGVKSKEVWTDGESILVEFSYDFNEKLK